MSQPTNQSSFIMCQSQPRQLQQQPLTKVNVADIIAQQDSHHQNSMATSSYSTYSQLISPSPYALFQPRNSITVTHPICLQQHPATLLHAAGYHSPYACFPPGSHTVAAPTVVHSYQYSPVTLQQPHQALCHGTHSTLTPAASTLTAAIGRSSSTPGLVESSGKVALEEMILPPSLQPLPSIPRASRNHSPHQQSIQHHDHQRSSQYSPVISPTVR